MPDMFWHEYPAAIYVQDIFVMKQKELEAAGAKHSQEITHRGH